MTTALPLSASLMIMLSSFFKFSIASHSNLFMLFLKVFLPLSCSIGNVFTVSINLSKYWFLPLGGIKSLLLDTIDSSSLSVSKKKSANRNLLQKASVSLVISSICFERGVGVNFNPFSSTLISMSERIRFDRFITFGSCIWSASLFCVMLFGFVWGHVLKKNS